MLFRTHGRGSCTSHTKNRGPMNDPKSRDNTLLAFGMSVKASKRDLTLGPALDQLSQLRRVFHGKYSSTRTTEDYCLRRCAEEIRKQCLPSHCSRKLLTSRSMGFWILLNAPIAPTSRIDIQFRQVLCKHVNLKNG